MKRPKKNSATSGNIVFDDDITMTGGGYIGRNLSSVIEELHTKTSKLENYLKWIYKYGGVGGTGGGGGNTTTSYSVYAELNRKQVTNDAGSFINLGASGTFPLLVKISRPGGANYRVVCTLTDNSGTVMTNISETLNLENNYTLERSINISRNGVISIKVTDSIFNETTPLSTKFITDPYTFSGTLTNNSGRSYSDEIFTSDILNNGLFLELSYTLSVDTIVSYKIRVDTPKATYESAEYKRMEGLVLNNNNSIYNIDIVNFLSENFDFHFSEINSGNYVVSIELLTQIVGEIESTVYVPKRTPISFTVVPQTLYLLVQPISGAIYQTPQDTETLPVDSFMSPGSISFRLKPYSGYTSGLSCDIQYKLGDESTWTNEPAQLRTTEIITIYSTRPGENSISFRLIFNTAEYPTAEQIAEGEGTYYFYIKESSFDGGWWHPFNKINRSFIKNESKDLTQYYRVGGSEFTDKFASIAQTYRRSPIEQTINRPVVEVKDLEIPLGNDYFNTIVNIGIKYNMINDTGASILQMTSNNGDDGLILYQNKLTIKYARTSFSTGEDKLYIPKTDFSSSENENDYHLITIVSRTVKEENLLKPNENKGKEVLVYIDGIIEATFSNLLYGSTSTANLKIENITLDSVNASFNLIDVSYLVPIQKEDSDFYETEDSTVYQYYLKYRSSILGIEAEEDEKMLLSYYDNLMFNPTNGDIYCTEDTVRNIARYLKVPTMLITVNDSDGSYKENLSRFYDENSTEELLTTARLKWTGFNSTGELRNVTFPSKTKNSENQDVTWSANTTFSIKIQGSSTKKYRIKNYTLSLDDDISHNVPLFSPNFKNGDTSTFLPESSFTLKADVVDSSHSNNTSIGKFVNDVTTKFKTSPTAATDVFSGYIKNCLMGFPFVIFMKFSKFSSTEDENQDENCYYHGVYNFNLGRESHYNLGYKDYNIFCDSAGRSLLEDADSSENGFCFFMANTDNSVIKDNIITAEIQGNSPFLDFSQYDSQLLFDDGGSSQAVTTMFGRITDDKPDASYIKGNNIDTSDARAILQRFVENVALSGGYIFESLNKTFSNDSSNEVNYGYGDEFGYSSVGPIKVLDESGDVVEKTLPLNMVPNYKVQFTRTAASGIIKKEGEGNSGSARILQDLIRKDDEDESSKIPWLNYNSLSEYYTICMAFCLIDSVQKNLTIKTWTADKNDVRGTFYIAFYDMDTCLGINNSGRSVKYTAFSDYWAKNETKKDGVVTPKSVTIYRDYSPSGGDYFDTASSYLFAVAKYPMYLANKFKDTFDRTFVDEIGNWPKQLWIKWRSRRYGTDNTVGCLESADYFVKNYFSNNLGSVGIPLINGNYRAKYIVQLYIDFENAVNAEDAIAKFNGTRIAKVKEWLSDRFHLLDAYFNVVSGIDNPIMFYKRYDRVVNDIPETYYKYTIVSDDLSPNPDISEPEAISYYQINSNPDVYINTSIFEGSTMQAQVPISAKIMAKENSPLLIKVSNWADRYLIGGDDEYYLYANISGNQQYSLLGSKSWTALDSINGFRFDDTIRINSSYIDKLIGDDNSASAKQLVFNHSAESSTIKMPSLKQISLTSPKYTGKLSLSGTEFTNLGSVNLSNSSIALNMQNTTCTELILANVNGSDNGYSVENCLELTTINVSGAQMNSLTINPIHIDLITKNVPQILSSVTSGSNALSLNQTGKPFGMTGTGFYLTNTHIKTFYVRNRNSTAPNIDSNGISRLEIDGDDMLTNLEVYGFSVIVIKNCKNLTKVTIQDPEDGASGDKLKRLSITKCGSAGSGLSINSTSGNLDLSNLRNLDFVDLSECASIQTVKFTNDTTPTVYLNYSAFYGDSSLTTIDGKAYIIGPSTFYTCNNFTLKNSEGNCCDLYVIPEASSLNSLFSTGGTSEGVGKIDLSTARTFVKDRVPSNNNVTSIENLFRGQSISYTEENLIADLGGGKNYIDMSKFNKVTAVGNAFNYNLIDAWHPSWFSFGKNSTLTNGVFSSFANYVGRYSSKTITTVPNVLFDIIDKISTLGADNINTNFQYTRIKLLNPSTKSVITNFKATDFFFPEKNGTTKYPINVETLQFLSFSNNAVVDFSDLFTTAIDDPSSGNSVNAWRKLNRIYRFEYEVGGNEVRNIYGLNNLFKNEFTHPSTGETVYILPPLGMSGTNGGILDSFRINRNNPLKLNDIEGQTFIDLFNFISWDYYKKADNIDFFRREYTQSYSDWDDGNFAINKFITYDNFTKLCKILFSSDCHWSGFSNIFKYCTVIADSNLTNYVEIGLTTDSDFTMPSVTAISSLFDGFRVIVKPSDYLVTLNDLLESKTSSEYVNFNYNRLINIFPNITNAAFTFREVKFKKSLPINFWNKRYKETSTVYIRTSQQLPNNAEESNGEIRFTSNNENYLDTIHSDYLNKGNLNIYDYRKDLSNLYGCFYNSKWYSNSNNGREHARNFNPVELNTISRNSIEINGSTITDSGYKYYTYLGREERTVVIGGISTTTYIWRFATQPTGLPDSTEFTDIEELTRTISTGNGETTTVGIGEYVATPYVSNTIWISNYSVSSIEDATSRSFIAPDILYPVKSNCSITNVFYSNGSNSLEGMLPRNLLKNIKTSALSGLLTNQSIIPRRIGTIVNESDQGKITEVNVYSFVPENFTEATNLDNAFRFKILLPNSSTSVELDSVNKTIYSHYYILLSNSCKTPNTVASFVTAFPNYCVEGNDSVVGLWRTSTGGWYNTANTSYTKTLHYSLMFNPTYNTEGVLIDGTEGIDTNVYRNAKFDKLLTTSDAGDSSIIMRYLTGYIFIQGTTFNNISRGDRSTSIIGTFTHSSQTSLLNCSNFVNKDLRLPGITGVSGSFNDRYFINFNNRFLIYKSQLPEANKSNYGDYIKGHGASSLVVLSDNYSGESN